MRKRFLFQGKLYRIEYEDWRRLCEAAASNGGLHGLRPGDYRATLQGTDASDVTFWIGQNFANELQRFDVLPEDKGAVGKC